LIKKSIVLFCLIVGFIWLSTSQVSADELLGTIDLNDDPNANISEVLTFEELTKQYAEDHDITQEEAAVKLFGEPMQRKNATSSTLTAEDFDVSPQSTYRTISSIVRVTDEYSVTIRYYVETTEGGSFRAIKEIKNVSLNRSWNGIVKLFDGDIFTYLENPNRIKYTISGDFYETGNQSESITFGASGIITVSYTTSKSSNYYAYLYREGYRLF
jgi:hypothetical protein